MKHLAKEGFDPTFGARPLKRVIQRDILDELALKIVAGEITEEDTVLVDVKKKAITIQAKRSKATKK